ncbi:MAG: hypothetical protein AAGA92_12255 [Planctomycetota bacterium]
MNQRAMWLSLFWKEWRERRWELASLAAILAAVPLAVAFDDPRSVSFAIEATLFPYIVIASFFLGSSVAAGEETRSTAGFLRALPAPGWQPALVKLVLAVTAAAVPILLVAGGVSLFSTYWEWIHPGDTNGLLGSTGASPFWDGPTGVTLAPILGALSLIIWAAAWGVGRKGEVEAGAWAVAAIMGAAVTAGVVVDALKGGGQQPESLAALAVTSAAPAGVVFSLAAVFERFDNLSTVANVSRLGIVALCAVASHGLLIRRFLQRFAVNTPDGRKIAAASQESSAVPWLGSPRKSPMAAILWKQVRETLPVCAIGLSVFLVFGVVLSLKQSHRPFVEMFSDFVTTFGPVVGVLVAIVAGIGSFLDDLSPGLHTFWRSRPVRVDQWYWTKFFAGLGVPLVVMVAVTGGAVLLQQLPISGGRRLEFWGIDSPLFWSSMLQTMTYCGAVAAVCLVRRPLYAAVFASSAWVLVYLLVATWEVIPYTAAGVGWLTAILSIGCAVAGWQALRHDIGWQR